MTTSLGDVAPDAGPSPRPTCDSCASCWGCRWPSGCCGASRCSSSPARSCSARRMARTSRRSPSRARPTWPSFSARFWCGERRACPRCAAVMIFLNGLWALTDLVYIPLLGLDEVDFYAKAVVNAVLAVGLARGRAPRRTPVTAWPPARVEGSELEASPPIVRAIQRLGTGHPQGGEGRFAPPLARWSRPARPPSETPTTSRTIPWRVPPPFPMPRRGDGPLPQRRGREDPTTAGPRGSVPTFLGTPVDRYRWIRSIPDPSA